MNSRISEQAFQGYHFADRKQKETHTVYWLKGQQGSGMMKCYDVAPGIQLSYNNLETDSCFQPISPTKELGDLCVSNLGKQAFVNSRLPLKKYRGITVLLEMEIAQKVLNGDFPQGNIDLVKIRDELCINGQSMLLKKKVSR